MGGVIVVDAGRSRSTCLGRDSYIHDHCIEDQERERDSHLDTNYGPVGL